MFGLSTSAQCPFCLHLEESHSDLFFDCLFSSRVWCAIEAACNIKWPVLGWPESVTFASKETKGNSLRVNIISNAFLCSVYMIWIERNNRIINKELKPEEVVILLSKWLEIGCCHLRIFLDPMVTKGFLINGVCRRQF